jgi:cystathionine gamma-synthase
MRRLTSGYPRFLIHPLVQALARQIAGARPALPFPSMTVARRAADFVRRSSGAPAEVMVRDGACAVATDDPGFLSLKAFWQHTGLIVSSREAQARLAGPVQSAPDGAAEVRRALRRHLAGFYDCPEEDVFLTPTGMAAQFAALRAVQRRLPGVPTAQLGFPYVDTLKLQQKLGVDGILLHNFDTVEHDLHDLMHRERLAACFCEIPGNPVLRSVDATRIGPLLRAHDVPLIVDDVVATPFNINVMGHADLVATSLTKFVVGRGDAMGGALICNRRSPWYAALRQAVEAEHEELLWWEDAVVIEGEAGGFPERMRRHNANGWLLAERLRKHPGVERVWYPKWETAEAYEAVRRPGGGWGALLSFLPRDAAVRSAGVYERLAVCKGPSLGTTFTLACPFTLMAHYTELDWADTCGVPRNLIRLSVGLEDPEDLWRRLETALAPDPVSRQGVGPPGPRP